MKEFREWLEQEIEIIQHDISLLDGAINLYNSYKALYLTGNKIIIQNPRYDNLTSNEIEAKVLEDCSKLEELKKQIELLQSARAINIYEVIEEWLVRESTWDVEIYKAFPDPYILFVPAEASNFEPRACIKVYLGTRKLRIRYCTKVEIDDYGHNYQDKVDEYNFDGITDIISGRISNLEIKLQSGYTAFLSTWGKPIIRVR